MERVGPDAPAAERADADAPVQRYFFVHVMKTGGMSLFQQFRQNFPLDQLYPTRDVDIRFDGKFRHLELSYLLGIAPERRDRIRLYAGHFPYVACEMLGGGFVTMTLLREPVERTISLLRQFQRTVEWIGPNHDGEPPPAGRTLEDVYDDATVFDALIHDHQTKIFSMTTGDRPQSYRQSIDVDASRLELAKRNLAQVDVVGLMDSYDEFLDELAARFGWDIRHDIRSNEAPAEVEPEPVSDALRARIQSDNAIDVEFFEYATRLVADRRAGATAAGGLSAH
jgi:hypothetical protein